MADIIERLRNLGEPLAAEAADSIEALRKSFADCRALAVAAFAATTYATRHTDGSTGFLIPEAQFTDLTAALARVGFSH